jgi:hypothetical protein
MKVLCLISLLLVNATLLACCSKQDTPEPILSTADTMKLKITVGQTIFTATLYDNATATAFKNQLPMTINMIDLNDNEKYYDLPKNSIPTNASKPEKIQVGDLTLYNANTLVLFYKSFNTSYSYTRIGQIDETAGLAAALGTGNVSVTFELE